MPINVAMQLTPKELKAFVKDVYRSLQKIVHPDRGGDNDYVKELNRAMERLENETDFMMSWQDYVANPDPFARSREDEVRKYKASAETLRGVNYRLDSENKKLKERNSELEGEVGRLKARARETLSRIVTDEKITDRISEELAGKQITYTPLPNQRHLLEPDERQSQVVYVVEGKAIRIRKSGTETNLGTVIGSIAAADLPMLMKSSAGGRVYLHGMIAQDDIASVLSPSLEIGRALVCRQIKYGNMLSILGVITSIEDTTLGRAKKEAAEKVADIREFKDFLKTFPMLRIQMVHGGMAPWMLNGLIFTGSGVERNVMVVRNGVVRSLDTLTWSWRADGRLVGCADPLAAAQFLESLKEAGESAIRKAAIDFFVNGGLNPDVKVGKRVVLAKSDLPILGEVISEIRPVDQNLLSKTFEGVITVRKDNGEKEYLRVADGTASPVVDYFKKGAMRVIGSEKDLELRPGRKISVSTPWIEEGSVLRCKVDKRTYFARIEGFESFRGKRIKEKKEALERFKRKAIGR